MVGIAGVNRLFKGVGFYRCPVLTTVDFVRTPCVFDIT